jgi:signal transduction histidine kinase
MTPGSFKDEDGHVWHLRCMGWLGKLSHDLRNQLAPMRTAAQLLLSKRLDPVRQDEMLETIDRQIQRMVRMIDDLSEFGRLQTGSTGLRREPVDLAVVIDAALAHCADRIRASGLVLVREIPDRPLMIEGDQTTLIQTLSRLIDNALKATSAPGSITIAVSVEDPWIDTRVIDTGRGLVPEQLDAIFSLPEGPRSAGSLGISLLLARAAAERHDGELRARSEGESRGSEFVLRLPLSKRQ